MLDLRQHGALQVRALAAVGEQAIRFWSQQDCRIGVGWIVKRERAADAEFFQFADGDDRPLTASMSPTTLETNPNLAHDQSETCQAQEFREVASSDIGILRRIDGEVAAATSADLPSRPGPGESCEALDQDSRAIASSSLKDVK